MCEGDYTVLIQYKDDQSTLEVVFRPTNDVLEDDEDIYFYGLTRDEAIDLVYIDDPSLDFIVLEVH